MRIDLLEKWMFGDKTEKELKELREKWSLDYEFMYNSKGFQKYKQIEELREKIDKFKNEIGNKLYIFKILDKLEKIKNIFIK